MADPMAVKRIGVFGHVGNGNLGDEATFSVLIQNIRSRYPSAQICCFSINPDDSRERHKTAAFPIRRIERISAQAAPPQEMYRAVIQENGCLLTTLERLKIRLKTVPLVFRFLNKFRKVSRILKTSVNEPQFWLQCRRNLKDIDLLIIAGSQQLIDYVAGGPWGHPYTIFKWVLIAKVQKTKVAFVSCGAGPIQSSVGRCFIRAALSLANYRSYRDELSKRCVEQLGVVEGDPVFPDLVYSLCTYESDHNNNNSSVAKPIVGINALPFLDPQYWVGGSARNYETYVGLLANFALWLIEMGYTILFFPTQLHADPPVIKDIRIQMNKNSIPNMTQNIIDYPVHCCEDLMSAISMTDMVIATRFHGIVMSYILNKPVLGIAYANKTNDLMEQMGQEEYVLNILQLDLKSLQERFTSLESHKHAIKKEIARRILRHRQALEAQYHQIFQLLEIDPRNTPC